MAAARELSEALLDLPALGVRLTKRHTVLLWGFEAYCEHAIEYQWRRINDPEHRVALDAFAEYREPSFERDYS